MPRCSCGGTLSVPMSKPRYTAVESQLTISPLKRSASAIPSALLPVAVGPTIATSRGRTARGVTAAMRPRRCTTRAPSAPGTGRPAALATAPSLRAAERGIFVDEEDDGHLHLLVRVLGWKRHRRIRHANRVVRG